ncbi:MAG: hypothetical protein GXP49_01385 [Deltaproteobacteria bacterium]|nr:hypothetical protein [Deltaproteobacteria bacterium]
MTASKSADGKTKKGEKRKAARKTARKPVKKKAKKTKTDSKKRASSKAARNKVDKALEDAKPGPLATLIENQAILFDELRDVRVRIEQLEDMVLLEINDLAKKIQDFNIAFYDEMNVVRKALNVDSGDHDDLDGI